MGSIPSAVHSWRMDETSPPVAVSTVSNMYARLEPVARPSSEITSAIASSQRSVWRSRSEAVATAPRIASSRRSSSTEEARSIDAPRAPAAARSVSVSNGAQLLST